jgi:hypothetical protein
VYYVEHTTERDADTTPGMEEVESRREQRPRYADDHMDVGGRIASGTAIE